MTTLVRKTAPRLARVAAALLLMAAMSLAPMRASFAQEMQIESLNHFPRTTLTIEAHGRTDRFDVWIANTPARQEQGLMFVRDLPASEGMLFPQFSPAPAGSGPLLANAGKEKLVPQVAHFWMKNTYIPLDMVFIGKNERIAKIIAHARPFSLDVLSSDVPVIAVLELKGGDTAALGIRVGDKVSWRLRKKAQAR